MLSALSDQSSKIAIRIMSLPLFAPVTGSILDQTIAKTGAGERARFSG